MDERNPVLTRLRRGPGVESVHRGAWVVTDTSGAVLDAAGDPDQPIFGRSATKSFQALPLLESGAADRFDFPDAAVATALASHSGETKHLSVVADALQRIGLDESALQCGPQQGLDTEIPTRLANNCSGKHAGFLAVATHLGDDPTRYLDPASTVQQLVRTAVGEMCNIEPDALGVGIDGCSAPTFQLPLRAIATGITRVANPERLDRKRADACRRMVASATAHPDLIAGRQRGADHQRICTELIAATGGRLFPKFGAEATFIVGVVGADAGLAIKIDDGAERGFHALLIDLLRRHDFIDDAERAALARWGDTTRRNWDGIPIGRIELA